MITFDRATNAILVVCAIAAVFLLVRRELGSEEPTRRANAGVSTLEVADSTWQALKDLAGLGSVDPNVSVLIEFVDVECPFCARYEATLASARDSLGTELEVGFIHYPLTQHRFARLGARAVECARPSERHAALLRDLLKSQDSLGLKPWPQFALAAGITDTVDFKRCLDGTARDARIDAGLAAGVATGITGTPAIVLDGVLFSQPPSLAQIIAAARHTNERR